MHEPLQTVLLVGAGSAVTTVAFFTALTIVVRNSLFPREGKSSLTEPSDYVTAYFGRIQ